MTNHALVTTQNTLNETELCDNCCDTIHLGDCHPVSRTRFLLSEALDQTDTKTVLLAISTWKRDNGNLDDAQLIEAIISHHF